MASKLSSIEEGERERALRGVQVRFCDLRVGDVLKASNGIHKVVSLETSYVKLKIVEDADGKAPSQDFSFALTADEFDDDGRFRKGVVNGF